MHIARHGLQLKQQSFVQWQSTDCFWRSDLLDPSGLVCNSYVHAHLQLAMYIWLRSSRSIMHIPRSVKIRTLKDLIAMTLGGPRVTYSSVSLYMFNNLYAS